jgi:adenine-specific DNA-methyltransferase
MKEHYESYTGTADLYVYFYERGIQLLREGGVFSFISSNKWFRAAYGEKLRGWLATHTRLHQVIDFGDAPVFTSIAYPCIVILTKEAQSERRTTQETSENGIRVLNWQPGPPVEQFVNIFRQQSFPLSQASLRSDGWQLESRVKLKLLERIRNTGTPLGDYVKGRFYRGVVTGLNEAFVIDRTTRDQLIAEHASSAEIIKPFLRGRDVKRWRVEPQDLWLLFTRRGIDIKKYPAIHKHLLAFKKRLMPGMPDGRKPGSYEWYEIQDNTAYWKEFEHPKILYPDIARNCEFAIDSSGLYPDCTLFLIPEGSLFLAGILNSNIVRWFFPQICPTIRGDFMRFKSIYVSEIPVPQTTLKHASVISQLVEYLLWLNQPESVGNEPAIRGRDSLMLGYFEQLLNGLDYELFFPEELHAQKLYIFRYAEEAKLPALAGIPVNKRLAVLHETFERIYDLNHPIRSCLFSLGALETVRIIEGEA